MLNNSNIIIMNTQKIIIEAHNANQETVEGYDMISINPKKKEFGSIRFATTNFDTTGGFLNKVRRVHYQSGKIEELIAFVDALGLKIGMDYSTVVPSRLIVEEQNDVFYEGQDAKINPTTGDVVTVNGSEVYRQTRLVPASSNDMDYLLKEGVVKATPVSELTETDIPGLNG